MRVYFDLFHLATFSYDQTSLYRTMMVTLGVHNKYIFCISYIYVFLIEPEQGDQGLFGGVYIYSCDIQNSRVVSPYYLA